MTSGERERMETLADDLRHHVFCILESENLDPLDAGFVAMKVEKAFIAASIEMDECNLVLLDALGAKPCN